MARHCSFHASGLYTRSNTEISKYLDTSILRQELAPNLVCFYIITYKVIVFSSPWVLFVLCALQYICFTYNDLMI